MLTFTLICSRWQKFGPITGRVTLVTERHPGIVNSACPGSRSMYNTEGIIDGFEFLFMSSINLLVTYLINVDFPTPFPPPTTNLVILFSEEFIDFITLLTAISQSGIDLNNRGTFGPNKYE